MRKPSVRTEWPRGDQALRFKVEDQVVEVVINWDYVQGIARRATRNKSGRSLMGPIATRVVKR